MRSSRRNIGEDGERRSDELGILRASQAAVFLPPSTTQVASSALQNVNAPAPAPAPSNGGRTSSAAQVVSSAAASVLPPTSSGTTRSSSSSVAAAPALVASEAFHEATGQEDEVAPRQRVAMPRGAPMQTEGFSMGGALATLTDKQKILLVGLVLAAIVAAVYYYRGKKKGRRR